MYHDISSKAIFDVTYQNLRASSKRWTDSIGMDQPRGWGAFTSQTHNF